MKRYIVFLHGYYIDLIDGGIYNPKQMEVANLTSQDLALIRLLAEQAENPPDSSVSCKDLWNALNSGSKHGIKEGNDPVKNRIGKIRDKIWKYCIENMGQDDKLYFQEHAIIQNSRSPKLGGYKLSMNEKMILSNEPVFSNPEKKSQEDYEAAQTREEIDALAEKANIYSDSGQNEEALTIRKKVYRWRLENLGEEDEETILAKANLVTSYSKLGLHDELAHDIRRQIYMSRLKILGAEHEKTILAKANLATSYSKFGWDEEARLLRESIYQWRLKNLGAENEKTILAMANLATTYNKLEKPEMALPLWRDVLEYREKHCSPTDNKLLKVRSKLAETLDAIGGEENTREAEQLRKKNS